MKFDFDASRYLEKLSIEFLFSVEKRSCNFKNRSFHIHDILGHFLSSTKVLNNQNLENCIIKEENKDKLLNESSCLC